MPDDAHPTAVFRSARDLLVAARTDYERACSDYVAPRPESFNWALDWFDVVAASPVTAPRLALRVVEEDGTGHELTYAGLSARSSKAAAWLRSLGVARGDRVLVMLGNEVALWEVLLACMKLGAVVIPTSTLVTASDLADRVSRGDVRHVVAAAGVVDRFTGVRRVGASEGGYTRIVVGALVPGWTGYEQLEAYAEPFEPQHGQTRGEDTLLLYFTSGTTARPKLVAHTHLSYPVGHLSTMYWIGLRPGDVHLNISSPGWAKHAWSSVFAPWNAEATVLVVNQSRFDAAALLATMERERVTTFCAPPTVYRMLVQQDLRVWRGRLSLTEMVGAGEPLNPEVIEQVRDGLGLTVRDGFGQTETTAQVANTPGQEVVPGSMGRPLPGYEVMLLDPVTGQEGVGGGVEGELCLRLDGPGGRPVGLMVGYAGDGDLTSERLHDGAYHTGDVASRDARGYLTYVGRSDDVFKASDYRISPFELESVLIEHPAVLEAAVVPSPDATRLAVAKAYVVLAPGHEPTPETAEAILRYARAHLAPYQRVRRLEFADLPKTISGKIRRVELRQREESVQGRGADPSVRAGELEFWDVDFPGIRD